jgi:hypothetical protein
MPCRCLPNLIAQITDDVIGCSNQTAKHNWIVGCALHLSASSRLAQAIWRGDVAAVEAACVAVSPHERLLVATQDRYEQTTLSVAVLRGHVALAKRILEIAGELLPCCPLFPLPFSPSPWPNGTDRRRSSFAGARTGDRGAHSHDPTNASAPEDPPSPVVPLPGQNHTPRHRSS